MFNPLAITKRQGDEPDMKRDHKCEECDCEAYRQGYLYVGTASSVSFDDMRKHYHWWCKRHYLFYMFGLVAFTCTEKCRETTERLCNNGKLTAEDCYVWLQFETVPDSLLCPRCDGELKPV